MLRREAGDKLRLAVLCGTIVVIPAEAKEALEKEAVQATAGKCRIEEKGSDYFMEQEKSSV